LGEKTRGYRELIAWQKSMDLVPRIYELSRKLPASERYALTNQIQRAVVSVPANIAEGQGRRHRKEFMQHLSIARGSLAELDTLLLAAVRLGYLEQEQLEAVEDSIIEIRRLLQGLIQSLEGRRE
jgi:four helix bundle protein